MGRQRWVHPELWTDPVVAKLSMQHMLLYIGLFSVADDDGRLLADPVYLKSTILPYQRISSAKVLQLRDEIVEKCDQLRIYVVDGVEYLVFRNYREWQKPKYPSDSRLPEPPADSPKDGGGLGEDSPTGWVGLGLDRDVLGQGRQLRETDPVERLLAVLTDRDEDTERTVRRIVFRRRLSEGDLEWARECAMGPGVDSPSAVAVAELQKRGQTKVAS